MTSNNNIPQGYKQTELGVIPEDWELKSVNKHCTVKARIGWQGLRSDEYLESGEYGLITSTDIVEGTINWSTCYFVDKSRYLQDPNIIINEDDTLVSKDGTIGKVGIVQNIPFPSTLNSGVFVIRPRFDNVYKKYFAFVFKSIYFHDFINRLTAGSTIVHLYQKDIIRFIFPVPPLAEQKAIAKALSDVDALISALDKKIAKKKLIKQGAMQQLLTGKKRLPGFTDKWVEKKVKKLFNITRGYVLATHILSNKSDGYYKYPVYSSQTQNEGILGFYFDYLFENAITWTTDGANAGEVNYREGKFFCTNVCGVLISEDGYANKCVASIINMVAKSHVSYIGNPKLMNNVMADIEISIPPTIKEQQAIATILSDMDKEISDLESKCDKYRLIKQGMMQKLLTGQNRLNK